MGLLEEAREQVNGKGGGCNVSRLLRELDEKGRAELQEALDADVDAGALSRALKARGHKVSQTTIQTHRRGGCCRG